MKIRPLQDRIIVKRIEEEEKTKGGIIIPDTAKEKPMEGEGLRELLPIRQELSKFPST